jgi:tryprostatin B 6-hydroxylase
LTYIFYHLAKYPEHQQKVREELETIPSVTDFAALQNFPMLKSFINETLRLFPPVPTGPPRISPPDGLTIDGTYIPGDTTVFTPRFSVARCMCSALTASDFCSRADIVK